MITIADDVYKELKELKEARGMSFSQILRFLLKKAKSNPALLSLAGTLEEKKIRRQSYRKIKEGGEVLF